MRIALGNFVFATPGELLFGSVLIYYFRLLERQMGISKFSGFVLISFVISTLLQVGALVAFPNTIKSFASGPYGFIFSSMTLVFLRVPRLHNFSIFGVPITDKFFAYMLAAQMAFSNAPSSFMAACVGIITGCVYHFDVVGLQKLHFPMWLQKAMSKVFIPRHQPVAISQAPLQNINQEGTQAQNASRGEALIGPAATAGVFNPMAGFVGAQQRAPLTTGVRANPELVEQIVGVTGMPRHQVEQALISTNNNPDAATAHLLRLD